MELESLGIRPVKDNEFYQGLLTLPWYGDAVEVDVGIDMDEDQTEISNKQFKAINEFITKKDEIFLKLEEQLFNYYQKEREAAKTEYDEESFNEKYPEICIKKDLKKFMQLKTLLISYYQEECNSYIGLVIDCDWDIDMGIGVKLIKNRVREINVQDIVI